jgi:hypothetical protein
MEKRLLGSGLRVQKERTKRIRLHFMVVINNLQFGDEMIDAGTIVEMLFENSQWLFAPTTPRIRSLNTGDRVVVYAAGRNNRCFRGTFTIASKPAELECLPDEMGQLARLYSLACQIKDGELWRVPKPIKELLPELSFIKDKKNYGLYLRRGLREISKRDYEVITRFMDNMG